MEKLELDKMRQQDHDLLIRLETMLTRMSQDIKDLSDGTSKKIADHEDDERCHAEIEQEENPSEERWFR